MFSRAIDWWDELNNEKKTLVHFVAHILEFATVLVLLAVVLEMKIDRMQRVVAATERAQQWSELAVVYTEQSRMYGEWLRVVRAKEGLIDSLSNSTKASRP